MIFGRVKELEKQVEKLTKQLEERPEIRICPECNQVKPKTEFVEMWRGSLAWYSESKPHCDDCNEKVKTREEAIRLAKENPDKIIKCAKVKAKRK